MSSRIMAHPKPPSPPAPRPRALPRPPPAPPGVDYGFYSRAEAEGLDRLLTAAGIPCRVGFDKDLSKLHAAATAVNPSLRRRSTFRDVKSGYFVHIDEGDAPRAETVVRGTSFRLTRTNDDADAPLVCAGCDRPLPADTTICPTCNALEADSSPPSAPSRRRWALWVAVLAGLALALTRALR